MTPMTAAPHAANRTAPAATSLAFSAIGWKSGEATSVRNSSAVLRASAVHTDVMANTIQHHSLRANRTPPPPPGCEAQHDPAPPARGQPTRHAHGSHRNRGHRMKPRVVLGLEHDRDAPHSALDTAQLPAECQRIGSH